MRNASAIQGEFVCICPGHQRAAGAKDGQFSGANAQRVGYNRSAALYRRLGLWQ
jgi:hypothetical protein